MYPTFIQIPENVRLKSIEFLQHRLCDAIDLMLQSKVAHWNVKGENFISLHLLFDEVTEKMRKIVDRIAERITQLGGVAPGDCNSVVEGSSLPRYPLNISEGRDHVMALCASLSEFGRLLKEGVPLMEENDEPGTADLLIQSIRTIDKYLWFVEAHVQSESMVSSAEVDASRKASTEPSKIQRAA